MPDLRSPFVIALFNRPSRRRPIFCFRIVVLFSIPLRGDWGFSEWDYDLRQLVDWERTEGFQPSIRGPHAQVTARVGKDAHTPFVIALF